MSRLSDILGIQPNDKAPRDFCVWCNKRKVPLLDMPWIVRAAGSYPGAKICAHCHPQLAEVLDNDAVGTIANLRGNSVIFPQPAKVKSSLFAHHRVDWTQRWMDEHRVNDFGAWRERQR